jgi:hypothetical protein
MPLRRSKAWGAEEKVYRRLLERLPYNQRCRALKIVNITLLYNYRVRTTGISQFKSYFEANYQLFFLNDNFLVR